MGGGRGLEKSLPGDLRTERWVKRQELTRAPRSAEEIALDDKEVDACCRSVECFSQSVGVSLCLVNMSTDCEGDRGVMLRLKLGGNM